MIVKTERGSSRRTCGTKFKDLLREKVKKTGENVKLLRESVKMFYNVKRTGLCVGVRPQCRSSFQLSKLVHAALVFSLVFVVSPGSVWAAGNTDFIDFSVLASYWRATDCVLSANCGGMDIEPDGDVDEADLADFTSNWQTVDPNFLFVQKTIYSTGSQDGRIWDDGAGAANGGANSGSADGTAIRLGDLGDSWSGLGYRSVLAFNMTQLPSDANILTARIELNRGGGVGQNPFAWGGNAVVDINSPYFGSGSNLTQSDWIAAAGASSVATLSENIIDSNIVESTLFDANGLNAFDVNSIAQMRIYFETITNAPNDPNYDYLGFYSGEYTADPNLKPRLIVEYLTTAVFTVEKESIATDDGRVFALDANDPNIPLAGTGFNSTDATSGALRLGDFEDNGGVGGAARLFSQRTVVSFDTSTLPANCTILSAKLQLTKSVTDGNDPFNWGGNCYIDANSPSIGPNSILENSDWQAVSDANRVAQFTAAPANDSPMISTGFNAAGLNAISKTAKTQLKVYFSTPYLANGTVDVLKFYSGEYGVAAMRPKLIIEYRVAAP